MIVSFFGSQHTFCYLQLQSEKAKQGQDHNTFFGGSRESDPDQLIGSHNDLLADELNLKTPANITR